MRRPAYASAQSDQRIYCSLPGKYNAPTYTQHFNIQASCSLESLFEHYLVKNIAYMLAKNMPLIMLVLLYRGTIGPRR